MVISTRQQKTEHVHDQTRTKCAKNLAIVQDEFHEIIPALGGIVIFSAKQIADVKCAAGDARMRRKSKEEDIQVKVGNDGEREVE